MAKKITYNILVTGSAVWVRQGPGLQYKPLKLVYKGDKLVAHEKSGDWYKHDQGGWSCLYDNGDTILEITNVIEENETTQIKTEKVKKKTDEEIQKEKDQAERFSQRGEFDKGYSPFLTDKDIGYNFIKNAIGIHGLPYQYMENVDRRLPESKYGRKYAEKIMARLPLLLMSPGRPIFMKGYSDKDKKSFLEGLVDSKAEIMNKIANDKDGNLYSFEYNYKDYYAYVNSMLSKISYFLGIDGITVYGQKLGTFKWDKFANSSFRTVLSSKESVAFYIDSDTQISESFSNETGESELSGAVNQASTIGQELQYLLGGFAGNSGKLSKAYDKLKSENYDKTLSEFKNFTSKYKKLLPQNLLNSITGGLLTVIGGGKMMFPEIWRDSSHSISHDISIKLRTPDCDNLSWFLNIAVPLIHLIAFVAPQRMGKNGYRSPFLIRAFYKGFFTCDMGIITSLNISKGDKERWTLNGLPTEIDINFTIKDLYNTLTLSVFDSNILECFSNTAMLGYLANLCGININKPDTRRVIDLFFLQVKNDFTDLISFNRFLGIQQSMTNLVNNIFD